MRSGKSIEVAVSLYNWLKTAKSGEVGIIASADKTIKITVEDITEDILRKSEPSLVVYDELVDLEAATEYYKEFIQLQETSNE